MGSAKIRGGLPTRSRTTKGTFHEASTNGKVYLVRSSESARSRSSPRSRTREAAGSRRPTMARWRIPDSCGIGFVLVERGERALLRLGRARPGDEGRLLEKVLHRVARLGLFHQEGDLGVLEAEGGREIHPQLLVALKQHPDRREELVEDEGPRHVQVASEFRGAG